VDAVDEVSVDGSPQCWRSALTSKHRHGSIENFLRFAARSPRGLRGRPAEAEEDEYCAARLDQRLPKIKPVRKNSSFFVALPIPGFLEPQRSVICFRSRLREEARAEDQLMNLSASLMASALLQLVHQARISMPSQPTN
jgi:hypothetical protein